MKRFPRSMKALREKYPRGTLIQCRIILESGGIVSYEGALGPRGSYFDRTLETARSVDEERGQSQETSNLPSAEPNEQVRPYEGKT